MSAFYGRVLVGVAFAAGMHAVILQPARAEITVTKSEYRRGVLVVRGETSRPGQRVTMDRRFKTRTDEFQEFAFRVRYLPRDCMVTLRAGYEVRPALVANCWVRPKALSSKDK